MSRLKLLLFLSLVALCQSYKTEDLIEGIMIDSLRSNHVQACEDERITLHCPRNTHIQIQTAFYGRLAPSTEICPTTSRSQSPTEDISCDLAEVQSKIVELCRNKRKCRIHVRPSTFERDPCPDTSKYLQIAYKCRPISFEDQNFCENSLMKLECRPGKLLSIYSAHYGRTVAAQNTHCSFRDPVIQESCIADALPALLYKCNAQSNCSVPVDDRFFGNPCPAAVSKYLSIIYMCVNEEVFSDAAIKGELESMQTLGEELEQDRKNMKMEHFSVAKVNSADFVIKDDDSQETTEPAVQLMSNDGKSAISDLRPEIQRGIEVGISTHNFQSAPSERPIEIEEQTDEFLVLSRFLKENKEKTALYLIISAISGLILLLLICTCQQCRNKNDKGQTNSQRSLLKSSQSVVEQGSLLGSNHSPIYLDADSPYAFEDTCASPFSHRQTSQHYVRFSQVKPPRAPLSSLHYYT
ncbi:hypothetical protein M3Y94_00534100 [Aphelenchoides besseyi]|nr:hypothetical protein M3Y94_00534100 [Aphelenchoides besseyi]KAI6225830.1 hypothetical protein M3Y95_00738400 [Aphelenchoides besseyi]